MIACLAVEADVAKVARLCILAAPIAERKRSGQAADACQQERLGLAFLVLHGRHSHVTTNRPDGHRGVKHGQAHKSSLFCWQIPRLLLSREMQRAAECDGTQDADENLCASATQTPQVARI